MHEEETAFSVSGNKGPRTYLDIREAEKKDAT